MRIHFISFEEKQKTKKRSYENVLYFAYISGS